jgi:hypothetical protein
LLLLLLLLLLSPRSCPHSALADGHTFCFISMMVNDDAASVRCFYK